MIISKYQLEVYCIRVGALSVFTYLWPSRVTQLVSAVLRTDNIRELVRMLGWYFNSSREVSSHSKAIMLSLITSYILRKHLDEATAGREETWFMPDHFCLRHEIT